MAASVLSVKLVPDTGYVVDFARTIARHMTALADDLETGEAPAQSPAAAAAALGRVREWAEAHRARQAAEFMDEYRPGILAAVDEVLSILDAR
jgi:hypothetical protein